MLEGRNFNFRLQENVTNVAEKILPKVPHSVLFKDWQSYKGEEEDKNMKLKLL